MSQKRVILFDLGRVLIDFDHWIAVRKIKEHCSLSENEIFNLFFDSDITDKYEKGIISTTEFFETVKNLLNAKITYEEFISIWNEIFTPHPGMLEVLNSLKDNYDIYLVSNINESHFKYLEEKFSEYFKYFSYIFLSYELGLRKPDLRIYQYIIDYLKLPPKDIIYTDDRIELVQAAQRLYIDAFLFTSTDSLKEELVKRDIKFDLALENKRL